MTKTDIFSLVFKIIGLYFFVMVITSLMEVIALVINFGSIGWGAEFWALTSILTMIFSIVVYLLFGFYLTFRTEKMLSLLRIGKDSALLKADISKTDVIEIVLAMIAVISIVYIVPHILQNISGIVYFSETDEFGNKNVQFDQASIGMLIQFFIGVFLLFNARNFAKWIVRRGEKDDQIDQQNKRTL